MIVHYALACIQLHAPTLSKVRTTVRICTIAIPCRCIYVTPAFGHDENNKAYHDY